MYIGAFLRKLKKVKNEVTEPKKVVFGKFIWKCLCFFGFFDFNYNFFAIFSKKKCARQIDPSSHFVFYEIFVAETYITLFFSIVEKLNISAIYKSIIKIFSVNFYFMYTFYRKDILIQPPGEFREQHLGEVRPKKFELYKIS